MKMTLDQTQLVGLTMELELKAREYHMLCDELDALKAQNIDPNSEVLAELRDRFLEKLNEIEDISAKLKELNSKKED